MEIYSLYTSQHTDEIVDEISSVPGCVLAAVAHGGLSDDIVNEISSVPGRVPAAVAHGRLSDDIVNEISGVPGRRRNVIYGVGVSENQVPDGAETVLRPRSRRR